jgi:hypothetical protein
MDVFHNYRWLVILMECLTVSVVKLEVDLSSHRHPPSNLAELMTMQTELLRQLVQGQQNQPRYQQHGGRDAQPAGYQEFFGTQPPLFSKADEPLDADAWLRTIDSKFALLAVPCADANKAHFAAQQLRGLARIWWDHYCAMQPAGHVISWEEF